MKTAVALLLAAGMILPTDYGFHASVADAAESSRLSATQVGDTDGDGCIDVVELVRMKKSMSSVSGYSGTQYDLNNDGACDALDMKLMRTFLVGKISSFYRPDTGTIANDTSTYTVTDGLDRKMSTAATKKDKTVGIRYFLRMGAGESNRLYSVSNILARNANAAASDEAWIAAGGGAVGSWHWWGEPLFGYYVSSDAWVISRDVQMLTDAGIDFIAVDTSEGEIYEEELTGLMNLLLSYQEQGFVVPKVAFTDTTQVRPKITAFKNAHTQFDGLWNETMSVTDMTTATVHVAKSVGAAMSAGAFYEDTSNHQRSFSGAANIDDDAAVMEGYNFQWEFEKAIASGKNTIYIESWNEWMAQRQSPTKDSEPIRLEENADIANSSDIQPMKDGYGDNYYMQMTDYIKQFKGKFLTNTNLNTVADTEQVTIDIDGEFTQWNQISTHYLDYTGDTVDRNADGYTGDAVTYINNSMAALRINRLSENNPMSFITRQAYAGGSTVSFKAKVPEGASWWAVSWTTDPAETDLYKWTENLGQSMKSVTGKFSDYSVTLPDDGNSYYIYIVGAKGEWPDKNADGYTAEDDLELIVDDFRVVSKSGETLAQEGFDNGLSESIFQTGSEAVRLETVREVQSGSSQETETTSVYTDDSGRNDIAKMKMTTDGTYLYAYVETVDDIRGFGEKNCMSLFLSTSDSGGCYNQYEYVVNRDSSKATGGKLIVEKYAGGRWTESGKAKYRLEGNRMHVAIPLATLGQTDAFKIEFKWADNWQENDIYSFYTCGDAAPYGRLNYVYEAEGQYAAIWPNYISDKAGDMSFITKAAYPAGSQVSFRAYIPEGKSSWWGFSWTTDPSDTDLYKWAEEGAGKCMTSTAGAWAEYSLTLPAGNAEYYLYFMAAKGEWGDDPILLDDFVIETTDKTYKDNFNSGLEAGLFAAKEQDAQGRDVVRIQKTTTETVNKAVSLNTQNMTESASDKNFITKDAYPAGSTLTFTAYDPGTVTWWGVNYVTDPNSGDIYGCAASGKNLQQAAKKGRWADYSITLPNDGEDYYFYFGGPKDDWKGQYLRIDDVKIYNADGDLIAKDDFDTGFENGLFTVRQGANDTIVSSLAEVEETAEGNQAAAIAIANMSESKAGAFMSRAAYPAGSVITFDAFVPQISGWWSVNWTTDRKTADMYGFASAGQLMTSVKGTWCNYTVTLPSDGGPYYFYIVGPADDSDWKDAGQATQLLIDNVQVKNVAGTLLATDSLDAGFDRSMFAVTDENAVSLVTVTENADQDVIEMTAYSAPTVNRKVTSDDKEALDQAYAKLADAGFTKAIAMHEGYPGETETGTPTADTIQTRSAVTEKEAAIALDVADKHQVSYLVKDWSFYGLGAANADENAYGSDQVKTQAQFKTVIENVFDSDNTYVKHNAYAGNFAFDEPYLSDMDAVAYQYQYFTAQQEANGGKGEMFVNLFGSYISKNSKQFGTKWDQIFGNADGTYEGYVDTYLSKVGTKLGYICWDNYPFMENGHDDKADRDKNYLSNYELLANKCKNNGVELRTFVQAIGDGTGLRSLNGPEDLRYQIYSGMAFGTQEFIYYSYSGDAKSAAEQNCIFNYEDQTYTVVYDWAKEVNREVHAMENIYTQYKWTDIMYRNGDYSQITHTGLSNLTTTNTNGEYGNVKIADCAQDTLVGIFTAKDSSMSGQNAYMFVNVSVPTDNTDDFVTVDFKDGAKAVLVCHGTTQTVIPISDNRYQFTLQPGEGAFIIPLN